MGYLSILVSLAICSFSQGEGGNPMGGGQTHQVESEGQTLSRKSMLLKPHTFSISSQFQK
jgi:hypothetical protein